MLKYHKKETINYEEFVDVKPVCFFPSLPSQNTSSYKHIHIMTKWFSKHRLCLLLEPLKCFCPRCCFTERTTLYPIGKWINYFDYHLNNFFQKMTNICGIQLFKWEWFTTFFLVVFVSWNSLGCGLRDQQINRYVIQWLLALLWFSGASC